MKILKSRPHNRVCISCGAVNSVYSFCKNCKKFKEFIHPNDFRIVSDFYRNPDLNTLKLDFNIKSIKSVFSILQTLRVPVGNYTLRYLIFNRERFKDLTYKEVSSNYVLNLKNKKFRFFFHKILPDKAESEMYARMHADIVEQKKSLLEISKEYNIPYETVYIFNQVIVSNEMSY